MNLSGIGYIGVEVPDLDAWNDYCTGVLGLAQVTPGGGGADASYMKLDDRTWRLAARQAATAGLDFLGFEVRGPREYQAALEHLGGASVAVKAAMAEELADRGVQAMSWFHDPAGNRLEVFWDRPRTAPSSRRSARRSSTPSAAWATR